MFQRRVRIFLIVGPECAFSEYAKQNAVTQLMPILNMIAAIPYQLEMGKAAPALLGIGLFFALVSAAKWRSDRTAAKRLSVWSGIFLLLRVWIYLFTVSV
jgi:hypothetical protein